MKTKTFSIYDLRFTIVWAALLLLLSTLNSQLSTAHAAVGTGGGVFIPGGSGGSGGDSNYYSNTYYTTNIYNVAATNIINTNLLRLDVAYTNNTGSNLLVIAGWSIPGQGIVESWVDYGATSNWVVHGRVDGLPGVYAQELTLSVACRPGDAIMFHDANPDSPWGSTNSAGAFQQWIYSGIGAVAGSGGGGGGDITAASLSSGTNSFAGNGVGLTNLNVPTVSYVTSGVLTTNQFAEISLTPGNRLAAQRYGMLAYNMYINNGVNGDSNKLFEIMNLMQTNGIYAAGWDWLDIEEGWATATLDADGLMQWDTTKYPAGGKAMLDYIHSRGFKAALYTEFRATTADGLQTSIGTNAFRNMTNWAGWGVDGVKADHLTLDSEAVMKYDMHRLASAVDASGRQMKIRSLMARSNPIYPWLPNVINSICRIDDATGAIASNPYGDTSGGYSPTVQFLQCVSNVWKAYELHDYQRPGFFADVGPIGGSMPTNSFRTILSAAMMLGGDILIGNFYKPADGNNLWQKSLDMRNTTLTAIHNQDDGRMATCVVSNGYPSASAVFIKPVTINGVRKTAVLFANLGLTNSATLTASPTNFGYMATDSLVWSEVFYGTNITRTGNHSMTLGVRESALFLVSAPQIAVWLSPGDVSAPSWTRLSPLTETPSPGLFNDGYYCTAGSAFYTSFSIPSEATSMQLEFSMIGTNTFPLAWTNSFDVKTVNNSGSRIYFVQTYEIPMLVTNGLNRFTNSIAIPSGANDRNRPLDVQIAWRASTNTTSLRMWVGSTKITYSY